MVSDVALVFLSCKMHFTVNKVALVYHRQSSLKTVFDSSIQASSPYPNRSFCTCDINHFKHYELKRWGDAFMTFSDISSTPGGEGGTQGKLG